MAIKLITFLTSCLLLSSCSSHEESTPNTTQEENTIPLINIEPTDSQKDILKENWIEYICAENKTLKARYIDNKKGNLFIQVEFDKHQMVLNYNQENSNQDVNIFKTEPYTWEISNQFSKDFLKEDNGLLSFQIKSDGIETEEILAQNCAPK